MSSDELQDEENGDKSVGKKFNIEKILNEYKVPIVFALIGLILTGFGVILVKDASFLGSDKVTVLESASEAQGEAKNLVVEVVGAVEKPGVYEMDAGSRIEDALVAAGGLSADADRVWVEKFVNRAAKITDGQKLYIFSANEPFGNTQDKQLDVLSAKDSGGYQSASAGQRSGYGDLVNINTATLKELDSLPGIGPVYGQSIIEHRPYSSVEELLSKDALKKSTYEKVKELVTVY
jgi:competence protein ComEA